MSFQLQFSYSLIQNSKLAAPSLLYILDAAGHILPLGTMMRPSLAAIFTAGPQRLSHTLPLCGHTPMDMKHFLGRLFIPIVAWGFSQQQLLDAFVVCNECTAGGHPPTSLWLEFSPVGEMHLLNQRKWFLVTGSLIHKFT